MSDFKALKHVKLSTLMATKNDLDNYLNLSGGILSGDLLLDNTYSINAYGLSAQCENIGQSNLIGTKAFKIAGIDRALKRIYLDYNSETSASIVEFSNYNKLTSLSYCYKLKSNYAYAATIQLVTIDNTLEIGDYKKAYITVSDEKGVSTKIVNQNKVQSQWSEDWLVFDSSIYDGKLTSEYAVTSNGGCLPYDDTFLSTLFGHLLYGKTLTDAEIKAKVGESEYTQMYCKLWIVDHPEFGSETLSTNALASGSSNTAIGYNSNALGRSNYVGGNHSVIAGDKNKGCWSSFTLGKGNTAKAQVTTALGVYNTTNATFQTILGNSGNLGSNSTGAILIGTGFSGTTGNVSRQGTVNIDNGVGTITLYSPKGVNGVFIGNNTISSIIDQQIDAKIGALDTMLDSILGGN